jgi:hypothetical protein
MLFSLDAAVEPSKANSPKSTEKNGGTFLEGFKIFDGISDLAFDRNHSFQRFDNFFERIIALDASRPA